MEPHEILEEINNSYEQSPFVELKTLSNLIAELRIYWAESRNSKTAWYLVDLWDSLLLSKFNIGIFVACDKNGVPLEKPTNHKEWLECKIHGHELFFINEAENQAYSAAQKNVIFEGWEVVRGTREYIYLYNTLCDIELECDLTYNVIEVNLNHSTLNTLYGDIKSLSDLAEATTENPLKLK